MARPPHLRLVPDQLDDAPALTIDCATCTARYTTACDDCLVTYLLCDEGASPGDRSVELDETELRQVTLLTEAGLAPESHYEPAAESG